VQCLGDVIVAKIGIGGKDFCLRHSVRDHADDGRNRNAKPPDAWHPAHLLRIGVMRVNFIARLSSQLRMQSEASEAMGRTFVSRQENMTQNPTE
jgi:hypothetical protein